VTERLFVFTAFKKSIQMEFELIIISRKLIVHVFMHNTKKLPRLEELW